VGRLDPYGALVTLPAWARLPAASTPTIGGEHNGGRIWKLTSTPLTGRQDKDMEIRLAGVGEVTIEELEARLSAYMNAGAPKPVLEGTREEQKAILECVRRRGDSQMQALVDIYLDQISS
jgi:hypothetical protein